MAHSDRPPHDPRGRCCRFERAPSPPAQDGVLAVFVEIEQAHVRTSASELPQPREQFLVGVPVRQDNGLVVNPGSLHGIAPRTEDPVGGGDQRTRHLRGCQVRAVRGEPDRGWSSGSRSGAPARFPRAGARPSVQPERGSRPSRCATPRRRELDARGLMDARSSTVELGRPEGSGRIAGASRCQSETEIASPAIQHARASR